MGTTEKIFSIIRLLQAAGMKIAHVISGLNIGGAEQVLYRLLALMDREKFEQQVVSLGSGGYFRDAMREMGVRISELGMKANRPTLSAVQSLRKVLKESRADAVQTWMYHADLLGGWAAYQERIPVVWNVRQARLQRGAFKRTTRLTARMCGLLSGKIPDRIISCSQTAVAWHAGIGYKREKFIVIPNGVDSRAFAPDAAVRKRMRSDLGIAEGALVVGMAARFSKNKGFDVFARAAGALKEKFPSLELVLCGSQVDAENTVLTGWLRDAGVAQCSHLLGARRDMADIYNALDVLVSASREEGFSNTLVEAMSCGVPCAATAAGDSALIVGETGRIVAPEDPQALSEAVGELLSDIRLREQLGRAARLRVKENFSLEEMVRHYEAVYRRYEGKTGGNN